MSKYIIVQKHGRPSTKKVFEQMQSNDVTMMHKRTLPNNVYYREYKKGRNGFVKVRQFNPNSGDIIVRWGNRIPYEGDGYICYNNIKSQERAHDKKKSREIMLEKGVRCPRLLTPENYNNEVVIARPINHSKGKNFVVLRTRREFIDHYRSHNNWYYSEFIDKESEFRVHCALGKFCHFTQ